MADAHVCPERSAGAQAAVAIFDRACPLIGRQAELRALEQRLLDPTGGAVVLAGVAGVGKTRLAREALARAARAGRQTEWVVATRSAASIPFGALSHLLPADGGGAVDRSALLRRAADELGRNGQQPVVLGVDDAHLLDDASAALVHQLVSRSGAALVATVRSDAPVPEWIVALWKDGLAARVPLPALPGEAVDELLGRVLPGQIDAVTRQWIGRVAAGNPLFLRELVVAGLEEGSLSRDSGLWRWRGGLRGSARLAELVGARLDGLGPTGRAVLELAACGETLPLALLERLADPASIVSAEQAGLLAVERSGRRLLVRMSQPLYREVLRATLPVARARAVWGKLAATVCAEHLRRRDDLLRVASWQLEAGSHALPDVFLPAARQSDARFDLELAERLARAACDTVGGHAALQVLAETLEKQGRHAEAVDVLSREPPTHGDHEHAEWAVTRAANLYWGLARTADAKHILDDAVEEVTDQAGREEAAASLAWILLFDGRCRKALTVAAQVLERPAATPRAVVWAATVAVPAHGFLGEPEQALAVAERGLAVACAYPDEAPWGEAQLGWALCHALVAAGRLQDARERADAGYRAAAASRSPWLTGGWAVCRGLVARPQGDLATARAALTEAVALLGEQDPYRFVRVCLGELAHTAALSGDSVAASAWMAEVDRREGEANKLFGPRLELDRAWVVAATGDLSRAMTLALGAAELARSSEQYMVEAAALHDVARLGGATLVTARLAELAAEPGGGMARAYAASASALAAGDGPSLDAAAGRFQELGALLLAAEAAAAAARVHRAAGRHTLANASTERAAALASRCHGARTPALRTGELGWVLTAREREVAALAATGVSSRHIAEHLGVSVRTVDNHLCSTYAKFGISGRAELAVLFEHDGLAQPENSMMPLRPRRR